MSSEVRVGGVLGVEVKKTNNVSKRDCQLLVDYLFLILSEHLSNRQLKARGGKKREREKGVYLGEQARLDNDHLFARLA